jgi:D-arabinose 1-dehydrogenase-like Zn-dependent alcohol dehydrogenase
MTLASAEFSTYVYSRELPRSPRIDLVAAIGATYLSTQTATFAQVAAQIGNIDLIYEAVGAFARRPRGAQVLGTDGIFVLTGVAGLQALAKSDPARLIADRYPPKQALDLITGRPPGIKSVIAFGATG